MKKLIYLFLAVCCSMAATAQSFEASVDYTRLSCLIYDPVVPNRLYAATTGNHIVVSADNAATWDVLYSHPTGEAIRDLRLVAGNTALSFGTRQAVHILDLATATLTASVTIPQNGVEGATPSELEAYSLYDDSGETIAIITEFRVEYTTYMKAYYTQNAGAEWSEVYFSADNENVLLKNIAISPENPNKVFMARSNGPGASRGGLWISDDQGGQWTEKLTGKILKPIAFNPANPSDILAGSAIPSDVHPEVLYRSADNGQTWTPIDIPWFDGVLDDMTCIVFNPANTRQIVILEENEILWSEDNGGTWEKNEYPLETSLDYFHGTSASFNPFDNKHIAISSEFYPRFFNLATQAFSPISAPFLNATSVSVTERSQSKLYYGAQGGRHRKDLDSGAISAYDTQEPYIATLLKNYIFTDPIIPGRIFTFAGISMYGGTLSVSTDQGATTAFILETFADDVQAIATDPNNTNIVYLSLRLGESGTLYKIDLTDTGNISAIPVITPQISEFGFGVIGGIVIDPLDSNTLFINKGNRVFRSLDSGQNWQQITTGLEAITDLDLIWQLAGNPLDPNQLTVASNVGVFTSLDKGLHWSPILEGVNIRRVKHSPIHNGVLAGAALTNQTTPTAIYHTADNGQSWETVSPDTLLFAQSQGVDFLFDGNDVTAYLATTDLGVLSYRVENVTLGTQQPQPYAQGGIYPNPATDTVTVYTGNDTDSVAVNVYNLNGQLVLQSGSAHFDISALSKGVYIVKVQTGDGSGFAQKLIKQ